MTEINQPLQFWKEDKLVHTLRPVEAYVLDDSSKRLDDGGVEFPIHTAQRWILSQSAPGESEMSANLGDLLKAPEGEVVLDPIMTFQSDITKDTRLQQNSYSSYYYSWYAPWQQG